MTFALLDDSQATADRPTSRLYRGFLREHRCDDPASLDATWAGVEADQRAGLHALLLADYEWGVRLQGAGGAASGALRVLMFERLDRLSREQVDAWLAAQPEASHGSRVTGLRADIDEAAFARAIDRIHEAIAAGETYQVNFSHRIEGGAEGPPLALYRRLRDRQPVPFGAFIALPEGADGADGGHVLSCSPELFLRRDGARLLARPMKGTAARGATPEADREAARALAADPKNRAENLMIVDLLRNDLGRVARTGSVRVPALFEVEAHRGVLQMTSTVEAELRPGTSVPDLLRASFPCGSITGAPKHRTMGLIESLEGSPRGLYCGAIGWVDAGGDLCLSVAIRTLTLGPGHEGRRALRLGVGAGIVKDSRAADEFEECRLKARFLTGLDGPG